MPDSYCYYLVYVAFLFILAFVGLHLYPTRTFLGFIGFVDVHFCIQFYLMCL